MTNSLLVNISTSSLENISQTHNFSVNFSNLEFDRDKKYMISLLNYSLWYSWYNISSGQSNNLFNYNNGVTGRVITIPDGQYGVSDINSIIKAQMTLLGDDQDAISITGNFNTLKVDITIVGAYTVSFSGAANDLSTILGFTEGAYSAGVNSSQNQVNITNSIDAININTSLIDSNSNLLNDNHSNCIYQFVPQSGPGSNLSERISYPIYLPLNSHGNIYNVQFSITDQAGNILDLNGEQVSLSFHIKEDRNGN